MYSVPFFRRKNSKNQDIDSLHDAKVNELRAALGPLSGRSLQYCTDACLRRYLEARNWNVEKAKKMLEETLQWRSTYKPEQICWHEVADVGKNGLISRADFHDRFGRIVLIMRPGMQKTTAGEGNLRHLVYLVENAILSLPEGQEQMTWLIDFTGWSLNTNVPIKVARDIIYVLQNHYPERLALIALYDPPRIFQAFWKVVMKRFYKPVVVEVPNLSVDVPNLPIEVRNLEKDDDNSRPPKQRCVEINLENFPADRGLRPRIGDYNPNEQDQIRRYYLNGLTDLSKKMVETRRDILYPLVYLLLKLTLILPIATATVERVFSAITL